MNKKRYSEKVQMKKTIKAHQEKKTKGKKDAPAQEGAVPRLPPGQRARDTGQKHFQ